MFLTLNHQQLQVFQTARQFVLECYKISGALPVEEKFGMVSQIRRAALSVYLNIAEGSSRRSSIETKRFFEISRASLIEIDAALDIASDLGYIKNYNPAQLGQTMISSFKLLSRLIQSQTKDIDN